MTAPEARSVNPLIEALNHLEEAGRILATTHIEGTFQVALLNAAMGLAYSNLALLSGGQEIGIQPAGQQRLDAAAREAFGR